MNEQCVAQVPVAFEATCKIRVKYGLTKEIEASNLSVSQNAVRAVRRTGKALNLAEQVFKAV